MFAQRSVIVVSGSPIKRFQNRCVRNYRSKGGTVGWCAALVQEVLSSIPGSRILVSTPFLSVWLVALNTRKTEH